MAVSEEERKRQDSGDHFNLFHRSSSCPPLLLPAWPTADRQPHSSVKQLPDGAPVTRSVPVLSCLRREVSERGANSGPQMAQQIRW